MASANDIHWKDVFAEAGRVLRDHGILSSDEAEPKSISYEEAGGLGL